MKPACKEIYYHDTRDNTLKKMKYKKHWKIYEKQQEKKGKYLKNYKKECSKLKKITIYGNKNIPDSLPPFVVSAVEETEGTWWGPLPEFG